MLRPQDPGVGWYLCSYFQRTSSLEEPAVLPHKLPSVQTALAVGTVDPGLVEQGLGMRSKHSCLYGGK